MAVDAPRRQFTLRPFCPWNEFSWDGARLGNSVFNVSYKRKDRQILGRITNRNLRPYDGMIELMLQKGQTVQRVSLNGKPAGTAQITTRFGRPAVRIHALMDPGSSAEVMIAIS